MNVLFAYDINEKEDNPFVKTLIKGLENLEVNVEFGLEKFWNPSDLNYDIVHIQWPEALFGWKIPSTIEFSYLKTRIKQLREKSKIIYTRHNSKPHNLNDIIILVYRFIEENCDLIIHLGNYSKEQLILENPKIKCYHIIIPHHTYDSFYIEPFYKKDTARKILKISKGKRVLLCFGAFRHKEERSFFYKVFKSAKIKNKVLLAPHWFNNKPKPTSFLKLLKYLLFFLHVWYLRLNKIYAGSCFINHQDVPTYFCASDVILIQRLNTLNSGNITLSMLFSRPVVGPDSGNIKELLNYIGQPVFISKNLISCKNALEFVFKELNNNFPNDKYLKAKNEWSTSFIAEMHLNAYSKIISRSYKSG